MARFSFLAVLAVLGLTISVFAQFGHTESPLTSSPPNANNHTVYLSGKVALEDGSPVRAEVALKADCGGEARTLAYADARGDFAFELYSSLSPKDGARASDSTSLTSSELATCDLRAEAPGFAAKKVPLAGLIAGESGMVNIGTIVLHPTIVAEGYTVSAADAAVPDKAKKELTKGRKEAQKGKIAAARQLFENLATRYPKFALAWIELGRIQAQQSDATAARTSFREALSVDQKQVIPYVELAELALRDSHWQELTETTSKLLEIAPSTYPQFWFFNAVGNYNLHNFGPAEKSLWRGLALDSEHRFPKMEYLMGLILENKRDYNGAAERFANYLKFSPKAEDLDTAQRHIRDCHSAAELAVANGK